MLERFVDMAVEFWLEDRPLMEAIAARHPFMVRGDSILTDGEETRMVYFEWRPGVRVQLGTQNCGQAEYLLADANGTLIARRQIVAEWYWEREDTLRLLPGVILPEQEEELFQSILLTVSSVPPRNVRLEPTSDTERRLDREPPSTPVLSLRQIWRGRGAVGLPNGTGMHGAHDDDGSIALDILGASDNRTSPDSLRYRFHVVDGDLPQGLQVPAGDRGGSRQGLRWADGRTWTQDAFSFRLSVSVVDNAGNESARSNIIEVSDDGAMEEAKKRVRQEHGAVTFMDQPPRVLYLDEPFVIHPWKSE